MVINTRDSSMMISHMEEGNTCMLTKKSDILANGTMAINKVKVHFFFPTTHKLNAPGSKDNMRKWER